MTAAIYEFEAIGPHDFFLNSGNDDVTFEVSADGRVTGLIRYGDGKEAGGGEKARRITE